MKIVTSERIESLIDHLDDIPDLNTRWGRDLEESILTVRDDLKLIKTVILKGESDAKELAEIKRRAEEQRKAYQDVNNELEKLPWTSHNADNVSENITAINIIDYILKGETK